MVSLSAFVHMARVAVVDRAVANSYGCEARSVISRMVPKRPV